MVRRTTRSELPRDPASALRALRVCRDAMVEVCKCVTPMGLTYRAASLVIAAIDAMATLLTGDRYYFFPIGSGATAQNAVDQEKLAKERGEKPWSP